MCCLDAEAEDAELVEHRGHLGRHVAQVLPADEHVGRRLRLL